MAFMLFKKERKEAGVYYANAHQSYKLAGYGLLYNLWNKRGKPVESGWSITADELLKEHDEKISDISHALVIDFDPNSQSRIGLVEIEAIHIYTYGDKAGAAWSPIMLELRDVYYEEFDQPITPDQKSKTLARVPDFSPDRKKIVEFLYVRGESWNWGRNGITNAAFIYDDARKYFQKFFIQ